MLAIFVAGAVLTSPLHLTTLLYLRDYSKAPFLTALWVLLGALVAAPLSVGGTLTSKRVLALAAAYGLVLAIGSGFRNDVLIAAPPLHMAIAFLPGGIFANFALKVEALAIAGAATFLLAAWPLLGAYAAGGGASMQHVALLGLMANFNESLDVAPSIYELGHTYDDSLVTVIITNYAARRQHVSEPIADYNHRYDTAASAVIRNVITTFPGDILARAYASAFTMATLPTSHFFEGRPPEFLPRGSAIERFYQLRSRVLHAVPWIWSLVIVLALLLACAASVRVAIFVALAGLYFSGYPAIQFGRHYFHLSAYHSPGSRIRHSPDDGAHQTASCAGPTIDAQTGAGPRRGWPPSPEAPSLSSRRRS